MSEKIYVELSDLQNFCRKYTEYDAVQLILCGRTDLIPTVPAIPTEQKPYKKFENVKDHIYKLAGDYKCWDNRLTDDEALELCHILEQKSIPIERIKQLREEIDDTACMDAYMDVDKALSLIDNMIKKYEGENSKSQDTDLDLDR